MLRKWIFIPCIASSIYLVGAVSRAADNATVTVPLRVHIVDNLTMQKNGVHMQSWVSERDLETTVLPEVNRIWKQANLVFTLETVVRDRALNPSNKPELTAYIANSRRDGHGESNPKRIKKLNQLIDWSTESPDVINVYLVPYLGQASQGNTKRKLRRIYLGQWTDKVSKGNKPPERFQLIEHGNFKKGSLSRTLAHELGHVLGLKHPDKQAQTVFGLLMGGKRAGYALTPQEIDTARVHASLLD